MSNQGEFDFEAKAEPPKSEATKAIVERIKKLLRLGADKRGNPHEAERALQLAYELMEKYRVDEGALNLDEATEQVMHEAWDVGSRYDRLRRGVIGILISYFHVTVVCGTPKMFVVGKPTDVLLAHYVHDFLLRAGRNCLREYEACEKRARRRMSTGKRANYVRGFIWGLHKTLMGSKDQAHLSDAQNALVLAEDAARANYISSKWKTCDMKQLGDAKRHQSAIDAGFEAGRKTTINQPLESSRPETLLLG